MAETHLSALTGDESGERLGVETREGEAETAVHAVSRQLQRLLTDVVLRTKSHMGGHAVHPSTSLNFSYVR